MRKISTIYLLFIALLATSCQSRVETIEPLDLSNGGAVRLNLNSSASLTKVGKVPTPLAEEFLITVASTTAAEDGQFPVFFEKQYGEMPLAIVLKEGEYNVSAICGANDVFSTTAPTYYASQTASVQIGQTTDIQLTATIRSYLIDIIYTEEFKKAFSDFYIEAHVVDDRFTFATMADQVAYLAPGSTTLVLKGTTASGQAYSSVIKEISSAGREQYILTLSIRPQGHAFDVTVDTQVEQIGVNGSVDPDLYPDMPEILTGALAYTETVAATAGGAESMITMGSIVGIADVELTFTDENLAYLGIEKDRVYHFNNADDLSALSASGLTVDQAAVIGKRTASLDLSSFSSRFLTFDNQPSTYRASIKVVDQIGKTTEKALTITVANPSIKMADVPTGNCWTKMAYIARAVTAEVGNAAVINASGNLIFQYSSDQTNWIELTADELTGLTPATTYYVRAIYRDNIISTVTTFTTETPRQIPNSDFESWQDTRETKGDQQFYRWAKDGQEWWSSLNTVTCASPGYDYWYVSQSSSRTATGRSGLGVLMHTAGYGKANTWAGYLWSAAIYNVTAGKLFLGTYSGEQQNGKEFNSRPTAVTYWYKYAPHPDQGDKSITRVWVENRNGSTTTIIGEGSFAVTSNVSSYTQNRINIAYSNTSLPATHICMEFMAGVNQGEKKYLYDKTYDSPPFANQYYYYGSRFWLDDVELIYDK